MLNKAKLGLLFIALGITAFVLALVKFRGDWKVGAIFFALLITIGGVMNLVDSYVAKRVGN